MDDCAAVRFFYIAQRHNMYNINECMKDPMWRLWTVKRERKRCREQKWEKHGCWLASKRPKGKTLRCVFRWYLCIWHVLVWIYHRVRLWWMECVVYILQNPWGYRFSIHIFVIRLHTIQIAYSIMYAYHTSEYVLVFHSSVLKFTFV